MSSSFIKTIFSSVIAVSLLLPGSLRALASGEDTKLPQPIVPFVVHSYYNADFPVEEQLSGYLGRRYYANLEKRLLNIDEKEILAGFIKRPGKQEWIGEHVGKYLETAANTWTVTKDPRLKAQMNRIAATLMSTQMSDGYLGTYLDTDRWTSWDVWVHKYDIYGLLAYYRITGNTQALETCKKVGDLLCRTFGNASGQRDIVKAGEHIGMAATSVLDPMAELYRWTGDKKYLDFCFYIISAYDQPNGPKIIKTLLTDKQVNKVANGKAYEMLSNLVGITKLYRLTGKKEFLEAAENAFTDIVSKRLYISGTASDHEVFKDDFNLHAGVENDMGEGCVTTTWIQLNTQLFTVTGEMKYFNEIERSLYNHLLAAENPQSGCVSYYTPLIGKKPYSCEITCCLSSVARGVAFIPYYNYAKINAKPTILLYESTQIKDTVSVDGGNIPVEMDIKSDFPQTGHAVIYVSSASGKAFDLQLRIPQWCTDFKATVGQTTYTGKANDLLTINRKWSTGDEVTVTFNMPVSKINGDKTYPNSVAFQRGPQLLCYDRGLNTVSLNKIQFPLSASSAKAKAAFPVNWIGSQAYLFVDANKNDIVLVPYADAGQNGAFVSAWLPGK